MKPAAALLATILQANVGLMGSATSQPAHCRSIQDDKARLACFDAQTAPTSDPETGILKRLQRTDYASKMEKQFLAAGMDVQIRALQTIPKNEKPDAFLEYPRLHLFGYFDRPIVFKLLTDGHFLDNAWALGFRAVEFSDRGGNGRWFYVSPTAGGKARCDQMERLCF